MYILLHLGGCPSNFRKKAPMAFKYIKGMSSIERRTEGKETLPPLALGNANQSLNTRSSDMWEIRDPLFPLVAVDWDSLSIRKVGPGPLNMALLNLRNSRIPQAGYKRLRHVIHNGLRELSDNWPRYWWLWTACIRQVSIFETLT